MTFENGKWSFPGTERKALGRLLSEVSKADALALEADRQQELGPTHLGQVLTREAGGKFKKRTSRKSWRGDALPLCVIGGVPLGKWASWGATEEGEGEGSWMNDHPT